MIVVCCCHCLHHRTPPSCYPVQCLSHIVLVLPQPPPPHMLIANFNKFVINWHQGFGFPSVLPSILALLRNCIYLLSAILHISTLALQRSYSSPTLPTSHIVSPVGTGLDFTSTWCISLTRRLNNTSAQAHCLLSILLCVQCTNHLRNWYI